MDLNIVAYPTVVITQKVSERIKDIDGLMKKKKINLQDVPLADYVVFSIKMVIIYTIILLVMAICGKDVSSLDTLTTCFYSVWGGECLTCGIIKVFKLHKEVKTKNGSDGIC